MTRRPAPYSWTEEKMNLLKENRRPEGSGFLHFFYTSYNLPAKLLESLSIQVVQ
ncbi:hypothetical protein [Halobacillus campisalis]|uniref:Uncharacterized protein n=1 Tax=Halobacillus campisalis TaxID=435909 RepID=A0ABW2JZR1_9BACI|nr:hypothetical protein [Halobacillus campisalis]